MTDLFKTTEYTDLKNETKKVYHKKVILTDSEKRELEDKIAEDLYRIFSKGMATGNRA
ncbi:MAG: hypothetical protein ACI3XA_07200 [Clostridia bacterium]